MYTALRNGIARVAERFATEWPTLGAIYLPDGDRARRRRADSQSRLGAHDERRHRRQPARGRATRPRGVIQAAIDYFYSRPGRRSRPSSSRRRNAFRDDQRRGPSPACFTLEDFAAFGERGTQLEEPLRATYRGVEVLKCGPWSQGPVFLQQLKLLEGFDLRSLGHNTRRLPARLSRGGQARLRRPRALLRRPRVRRRAARACCSRTIMPPSAAS